MKKRILFVCLGNICRSPSAEAVFNGMIKKEGLQDVIECDSAGTAGYHEGERADQRMQSHAIRRGYRLTSISRKFRPETDFDQFDFIIGMDDQNVNDLQDMASNSDDLNKIYKMTDFCSNGGHYSVPDPYYGGSEGFELVLDILEDACQGLLNELKG
ncbi:low molecular weight protein-tyrosine-phosphatase [Gaoshiqia sp. Z1-71]|uniref:low molecular weight protein-tyrosine-phosphatase n=1 Tax=Gaoshiqia hydrogeniformans TaxID=3290090 RepID=UPI003BF83336